MKKQMIVALALVALSLTACGNKEEGSTGIGRGGANMAPIQAWAASSNIVLNGNVTAASSQQSAFQDVVSGFIEGRWAPEYLGYVSATASGGTGVYLGGRVELQSGALNVNNAVQMNIRTDSKVLVAIYDEYTGRPDSSGQQVAPMLRAFGSASGYVQGNRAYLKFTDEYGYIELEGTFSGQSFYGTFEYDNSRRWDGNGQGAAGTIGNFHVPTCQFFRCQ